MCAGPGLLDRRPLDERVELTPPRLDLWQLRHVRSSGAMDAISVTVRRGEHGRGDPRASTSSRPTGDTRGDADLVCHLPLVDEADAGDPARRGLRRPRATTSSRSRARRTRRSRRSSPPCASCSRAPGRSWTISRTALQDGRPDGKLGHNCSGKHAGMLAACRANGWPLHPYRDARPSAAAADRRARRRRRTSPSTAAACRRSRCRSRRWRERVHARSRRGSSRRCARGPSSSAASAPTTPS